MTPKYKVAGDWKTSFKQIDKYMEAMKNSTKIALTDEVGSKLDWYQAKMHKATAATTKRWQAVYEQASREC